MKSETKQLKQQAKAFFKANSSVQCPAFSEEVILNSKGLSHIFYKGSRKTTSRPIKEIAVRIELLSRALKLLKMMPLPQEESVFTDSKGKKCHYGRKHFWSVIPAWRKVRGQRVNAKTDLSRE